MAQTKELLGGQALIEGVMMKGSKAVGYAVYSPDKKLVTKAVPYTSWKMKWPILGFPIIRGFMNLIEMLVLGMRSIQYSLEINMPEEFKKQSKYEMPLSMLISLGLSFVLFIYAPASAFTFLKPYIANTILLNLVEGLLRITIFVVFISLVALTEDMRRVFGYHGAEHKTVHAYEAQEKLSVTTVKKYSVIHPRCGTSFILVVFVMSIIVFSFLGRPDLVHRILYKVTLLPLISGISYELIRIVAKMPIGFQYALLWPGLLMQRLTTREPDDLMIKAAIAALQETQGEV